MSELGRSLEKLKPVPPRPIFVLGRCFSGSQNGIHGVLDGQDKAGGQLLQLAARIH